ncbi:LUD domain-containing protein [Halostagnicola sp. A-GB9-2]|uniref:LUD domain-containing protein n=1 Tax=Halostagnicola sp. A-GB9-2 TaxID=3048066 RepID=UPI0024C022FD|nr:LUD domain-containing protein [Halostagnicola sp. A-GB9-2]MDJ1433749.1 LUD domain-containing protein [Halostagnicola sp. A-GB9-2]
MTTTPVDAFEQSLADLPVRIRRTATDDLDETLEACLDPPTIGVALPFDDISLADYPITLNPTGEELLAASTGVTAGGPAIAEYGSIVVTSRFDGTEHTSLYPDKHVIVLAASDIVPTLANAISELEEAIDDGLTSAVITTGPSATADMGAPVYGAHGPEEVDVIILTDR